MHTLSRKTAETLQRLTLDPGDEQLLRGTLIGDDQTGYSMAWTENGVRRFQSLASVLFGITVDRNHYWHFVNGDKTDYRKRNLILEKRTANPKIREPKGEATRARRVAGMAKRKRHATGQTGYVGVLPTPTGSGYYARISYNGVSLSLGRFKTAEAAARAYDRQRRKFGLAPVNFPEN